MVERNMCNAVMRGIAVPPGSKSTSRAKGSRRKLGYPTFGRRLRVRSRVRRSASGRRGVVADDARAREVGLCHSSWEADEQSGAICCGAGGAKGGDQGECGPAKHAPDSEPHKRVPGAGSTLRSYAENDAQRPLLEVKADTLLRRGDRRF
jgi:hypothetical protein